MLDQLSSLVGRLLFVIAFLLAGLAVWEKLTNVVGRTLWFARGYPPSRLLELAAIALLFVIALQLREMNQLGRGTPPG